jgi:hypothetical protein
LWRKQATKGDKDKPRKFCCQFCNLHQRLKFYAINLSAILLL